ncbi:Uncharacterized protein PECH_000967 [Penicillium ucsense]|uniref:Hpc2-related domain-containing protein n=1 Tax=Penicillium ucsense TaxID=2839758 RepID=A0A8J8W129_9EURO|nr:Uncharacterized protein PECM_006680 [Penicillium ucsense]KAF7733188.1 Uncharacterized protein PECH_000967 [Penicillium ucsense]
MSTDPPGAGPPKDDGPLMDEMNGSRRASAARRSRRKKEDDTATINSAINTPDTRAKKKEEKDRGKEKEKDKPTRAARRPREKSTATAASRKKAKLETSGDEAPTGQRAPSPTLTAPAAATASAMTANTKSISPRLSHPPVSSSPNSPPVTAHPSPPPTSTSNTQSRPALHMGQSPRLSPSDARSAPMAQSHLSRPLSQPSPLPHQPPQVPSAPSPVPAPAPAPVPARTSGRNFDPIRSAFENPSPAPVYSPPPTASPRPSYRASASPAISSIIDPPAAQTQVTYPSQPVRSSSTHVSAVSSPAPRPAVVHTPNHPTLAPSPIPVSSPSHSAVQTPQQLTHLNNAPYTPRNEPPSLQAPPPKLDLSPPAVQQATKEPAHSQSTKRPADVSTETETPQRSAQQSSDAMDIDSKESVVVPAKKEKVTTAPSTSKPPSPKPTKAAKEAPKIPQGSGLITTALFGGVDDSAKSEVRSVPNIVVHVPLNKGNQIINFAQLAEEQYGFAALHPRLAAHKERLARVAAAGAALERSDKSLKGISAGESADEDLSLDVDRDSDLDGDISMIGAGTNGAQSEASDGIKKKRRRKVEEYDRDDPFVDDSEMAWQEQAAASKDGFFVYSGPLVPEGEKVQVERADGTIKRGRGRGRGTGRSRGLTSQPHVPIAAAVPISQETGLPLRGPGSRGGLSRRGRGAKKTDATEKHGDRNGTTASASHEGRGGRGGNTSGRGGTSSRGSKNSVMSMLDIAPAPSPQSQMGNITPAPAGSPLAGPELMMK